MCKMYNTQFLELWKMGLIKDSMNICSTSSLKFHPVAYVLYIHWIVFSHQDISLECLYPMLEVSGSCQHIFPNYFMQGFIYIFTEKSLKCFTNFSCTFFYYNYFCCFISSVTNVTRLISIMSKPIKL